MTRAVMLQPHWTACLSRIGLVDPAALLDRPPPQTAAHADWQLLSKPGLVGRERWRGRLTDDRGQPACLYVKRYRAVGLRRQWDRILRQSPSHSVAWWEYQQALRLAQLNIPVARPVSVSEEMSGWFESRSAVILEEVPGDALDRFCAAAAARRDPLTRGLARHDLTRRVARFVSAFHQTGYRHRDLYLCHIFVRFDHQRPAFSLIDLARTFRPWAWRRARWTIKDLSQLDASAAAAGASRADRLRFLLAYLALQRASPAVRKLARRVAARSARVLRRDARRTRR